MHCKTILRCTLGFFVEVPRRLRYRSVRSVRNIAQQWVAVCHAIIRRFLYPYRRPPFLLRRDHRKRIERLNCSNGTLRDRPQPGPPVPNGNGGFIKEDKSTSTNQKSAPPSVGLYLWPDRIRWHFFYMALVVFGTGAIILWNAPSASFEAWGLPEQYLFQVVLLSFPFPLLVWLIPALVYSVFRIPVLDDLWESWPRFLKPWFQGIPQVDCVSAKASWRHRVCAYSPPFYTQWDAIYWSPQGSPQKTLLRAALADLYQDTGWTGPAIWHERAFMRWLAFWLAPIWGGYIALLLLLILTILLGISCAPSIQAILYTVTWLWMMYGVIYVRNESAELVRWGTLKDKDYRHMRPPLGAKLEALSPVALKLTSGHVTAVFGLINLVGVVAYLSFFAAFCS